MLDNTQIQAMTNFQLDEQLEVHRRRFNDLEIPVKTNVPRKADKLAALQAAIARYLARQTAAVGSSEEGFPAVVPAALAN